MIAGAADPLATYVNISSFFQNGSCLDASYADSLEDVTNTSVPNDSGRQWFYQTCMVSNACMCAVPACVCVRLRARVFACACAYVLVMIIDEAL